MYIFRAPIESEGPGMVSSLFVKCPVGARASRGLDKWENIKLHIVRQQFPSTIQVLESNYVKKIINHIVLSKLNFCN